jgi:hypothetical protein
MEDLQEEQVDGGNGVEETLTPVQSQGSTQLCKGERFQEVCQVVAYPPQGRCQESVHGPVLQPPGER